MKEKSVIAGLGALVGRLIDEHRSMGDRCRELAAHCSEVEQENRMLRERLRVQEKELARMQLAEGLAGGGRDRDKARARVNRLMREVDKCIALLESQPSEHSSGK